MFNELYTIVYYSANRESPEFEQKIIDNLKEKAGDIKIISVTQKPIDLGQNICVGDVGFSYLNEWKQILIGAREATTPYIIFAESDFLYPKDYFELIPKADLYRYNNVWIVMDEKYGNWYWRKSQSEGAQICKRDVVIEQYSKFLADYPRWSGEEIVIRKRGSNPLMDIKEEMFGGAPCISFKTGQGLRSVTNVIKGDEHMSRDLAPWGHISNLRKQYLGD